MDIDVLSFFFGFTLKWIVEGLFYLSNFIIKKFKEKKRK